MIPSCRFAIIDEAHQLEDVATQYFGLSVSNYRVDDFARDVDRVARCGADGRSRARRADRRRCGADHAPRRAAFFAAVQMLRFELPGATGSGDNRVRVRTRPDEPARGRRRGADLGARRAGGRRRARPRRCRKTCWRSARRAGGDARRDHVPAACRRSRATCISSRCAAAACSCAPRRSTSRRSCGKCCSIGMQATVLTSATLTVDGSFDYVRGRLGHRKRADEVRLDSEFDYARQSILYLPRNMPDPRVAGVRTAAAGEVVEILKRTRGRAFVLFTSYANLREVQRDRARRSSSTRCSCRARRRGRRCCATSRRRRTRCCSRRRASGRAWTWSARR